MSLAVLAAVDLVAVQVDVVCETHGAGGLSTGANDGSIRRSGCTVLGE